MPVLLVLTSLKPNQTEPVPIGLIESAVGGTQIEAWMQNATLLPNTKTPACTNMSGGPVGVSWVNPGNGALYNGMVNPYLNMTIKAGLWYQVRRAAHAAARAAARLVCWR